MERRAFLQLLGLASAAAALPLEVADKITQQVIGPVVSPVPLSSLWAKIDNIDISPWLKALIPPRITREQIDVTTHGKETFIPGLRRVSEVNIEMVNLPLDIREKLLLNIMRQEHSVLSFGVGNEVSYSMDVRLSNFNNAIDLESPVVKTDITCQPIGPVALGDGTLAEPLEPPIDEYDGYEE